MSSNSKAISSLWNLLQDEYVIKLAAPDEVTLERWQSDYLVYLREGFQIHEIQNEHRSIVDSALVEWKSNEARLLSLFDGSHDKFSTWFASLREAMWRDQTIPVKSFSHDENDDAHILYGATELSRMVVMNITWCPTFGAFLPLAIPEIRRPLAQVGMMMSSIFFLEMIAKVRDRSDIRAVQVPLHLHLETYKFATIDTCWLRAKELSE